MPSAPQEGVWPLVVAQSPLVPTVPSSFTESGNTTICPPAGVAVGVEESAV